MPERARLRDGTVGRYTAVVLAVYFAFGLARADVQPSPASALADDIIVLSKGQRAQEKSRTESLLGSRPGTLSSPFPFEPGTTAPVLGARTESAAAPLSRRRRDVLAAITERRGPVFSSPRTESRPLGGPPSASPPRGFMDLPPGDDEGPFDGLTLDAAIDRLLHLNPDLRTKAYELPQGDADVLSAGLRSNPIVFAGADSVPYGSYSPRRPGANDYSFLWVQPLDVSGKRRARTIVARKAKRALEAQYQNEVRVQLDHLYNAYVDVLAARESVRYRLASLEGLGRLRQSIGERVSQRRAPPSEVDVLAVQQGRALLELEDARGQLRMANQALGFLLDVPDPVADAIRIRAPIREERLEAPPLEELIRLALCHRPDLVAYRLGIERAQANVKLERAERFEDVFVLYTPWTYTNNRPTGDRNATSWSVGGVVSLPLFNRNQGNIARAEINVAQSQSELVRLERLVVAEVRRAWTEFDVAGRASARIRDDIEPTARRLRDEALRRFQAGERGVSDLIQAQSEYGGIITQYHDAVIRQRRSQLRLNTVVGLRLMP